MPKQTKKRNFLPSTPALITVALTLPTLMTAGCASAPNSPSIDRQVAGLFGLTPPCIEYSLSEKLLTTSASGMYGTQKNLFATSNGTLPIATHSASEGPMLRIFDAQGNPQGLGTLLRNELTSQPQQLADGTLVGRTSRGSLNFFDSKGISIGRYEPRGGSKVSRFFELRSGGVAAIDEDGVIHFVSRTGSLVALADGEVRSFEPEFAELGNGYVAKLDNRSLVFLDHFKKIVGRIRTDSTPTRWTPGLIVLPNETVVLASSDGQLAFIKKQGQEIKKIRTGVTSAPLLLADGRLVTGTDTGSVLYLNQDGGEITKTSLFTDRKIHPPRAIGGGAIVAGTVEGALRFLDSDGKPFAQANAGANANEYLPTPDGGVILISDTHDEVNFLNPLGRMTGRYRSQDRITSVEPLMSGNFAVIVGRQLLFVDASGGIQTRVEFTGKAQPLIRASLADGAIVVGLGRELRLLRLKSAECKK